MSGKPTGIYAKMVELLRQHPEGLTSGELRAKMNIPADEQAQFDRRRRDLRRWFKLISRRDGPKTFYTLGDELQPHEKKRAVSSKVRASVLHEAKGRCQMCGRTVAEDGIKLVVDHKIPQDWGGTNDPENLWAICDECNHGKKNHFESQDQELMAKVMAHKSVHVRIGELLKSNLGNPVPGRLIQFVADREDWQKRTRELRYLGWDVRAGKAKNQHGKVTSSYTLFSFKEWPENPSAWIQRYEKNREIANRAAESEE